MKQCVRLLINSKLIDYTKIINKPKTHGLFKNFKFKYLSYTKQWYKISESILMC